MLHLEANRAGESNQPRRMRTLGLEHSVCARLPQFFCIVDSQFSTQHFLIEDTLDTHWSSVGRICPATPEPKTSSRQGCLILWRSLSTGRALHPVPSALRLPTLLLQHPELSVLHMFFLIDGCSLPHPQETEALRQLSRITAAQRKN